MFVVQGRLDQYYIHKIFIIIMMKSYYILMIIMLAVSFLSCSQLKEAESYRLAVFDCELAKNQELKAACKRLQREGGRYQSEYAQEFLHDEVIKLNFEGKLSANKHYLKGNALSQQGQLRDAMIEYEQVVEIDSEHSGAYFEMSKIMIKERKIVAAIQYMNKVTELKPDWARAHFIEGMLYSTKGNLGNALKSYQHALDVDQSKPEYYYNIAFIYDAFDFKTKAREYFEKALALWKKELEKHPDFFERHPDYKGPYEGVARYVAQVE